MCETSLPEQLSPIRQIHPITYKESIEVIHYKHTHEVIHAHPMNRHGHQGICRASSTQRNGQGVGPAPAETTTVGLYFFPTGRWLTENTTVDLYCFPQAMGLPRPSQCVCIDSRMQKTCQEHGSGSVSRNTTMDLQCFPQAEDQPGTRQWICSVSHRLKTNQEHDSGSAVFPTG